MIDTEELRGYVQAGAKLLDEKRPGWAEELRDRKLDMSDSCKCVLGRVYGAYLDGMHALGLDDHFTVNKDSKYGFHIVLTRDDEGNVLWEDHDAAYDALDDLWHEQIDARLAEVVNV